MVPTLVGLALTAAPASAQAPPCNSLFAARIAESVPVTGCSSALGVAYGPCLAVDTPNTCAEHVYDDAASLPLSAGSGAMEAKWLPACRAGDDTSCAEPELVCLDGTRPRVYVDLALDANGADDPSSGRWVFLMGGEGGPCTGDRCWSSYIGGDAPFQQAMSTYHPDFPIPPALIPADGLMSAQAAIGGASNPFRGYHRVKFDRCSDGASDTDQVVGTTYNGAPSVDAAVPHRGDAIWEGLANFLDTAAGQDLQGEVDLPEIEEASHILLAASSDAAHWLIENGDQVAAYFQAVAPGAEIRIAIDGHFGPMHEGETRYNANPGSHVFDFSRGNPAGQLLPVGVDPAVSQDYDEHLYETRASACDPTDPTDQACAMSWLDRGVKIDASCVAAHGVGSSVCYDELHVLANHLETPFFVVADQRDPSLADSPAYATADGWSGADQYEWDMSEYRLRVLDQGRELIQGWKTSSELALSLGAPVPWNAGFFLALPDANKHTHFDADAKFGRTMHRCNGMVFGPSWTIGQALHEWLLNDTPFDAVEDYTTGGVGTHWVTQGHFCGFPQ